MNGSLGKILNTKHAVQLPNSSAFLCAWSKHEHGRNLKVTKDAWQDFSNDVAPRPWGQHKLLGNSPISVTDVITQAYKAELFSSMLFVLFLSSWKLHTEHFTLTFNCASFISLMHTLPLPQLSLLRTCRQQYWWYWKLFTGKESDIQKWMNFWMERSLTSRGVNLLDYRI